MPLPIGTQLGSYQLLSLLGAGGMGEVYRARDLSLGRDVALKILPDAVALDADRLARFEREARTLAALNHQNIAHLYEQRRETVAGGTRASIAFLAMELVDGEDLSARIARGAIPIGEALLIAAQIAAALETAHEAGIIHRDLKPANVKVREDGTVKVLDFGLAKALGPAAAESSESAMNSPTLTGRATQLGMILGTAAYMAPEQARGKAADRRADVWAFGVVLYEMLTGRRAFEGDDVSDVLAAVLRQEIDWTALPAETAAPIRRLLRRCLARDRRERLADMSAVRLEIADAIAGHESARDAMPPVASERPRRWSPLMAGFGGVGLLAAGALAAWTLTASPPPTPAPHVVRFSVALPENLDWTRTGRHAIAISPDGTRVAYAAAQKLFIRALDQLEPIHIESVADPAELQFSPDGQWIAFWANENLQKVAVTGGAPVPLARIGNPIGAGWQSDALVFGQADGLYRVSSNGGTPERIVTPADGERLAHPQLVLDGRALLFARLAPGQGVLAPAATVNPWDDAEVVVEDLSTHERRTVVRGGADPRYLPSGQVVYARAAELLAIAVDPQTLAPQGTPVRLVSDVSPGSSTIGAGMTQYAVSASGTLVHIRGSVAAPQQMFWTDGKTSAPVTPDPGNYSYPRVSPDGSRIAFADGLSGASDVFVLEWARNAKVRVTTDPASDTAPIWHPDGRRIAFASARNARPLHLYLQNADGTGRAEAITQGEFPHWPYAFTPDGKTLLYIEQHPQRTFDIYDVPVEGERKPRALVATEFDERRPALSPDGRWMAYQSNELGSFEIHVRPYPDVDSARHQVSAGGGSSPVWAPDGSAIYYRDSGSLFRVRVTTSPRFTALRPEKVFDRLPASDLLGTTYALELPAGRRFLVIKPLEAEDRVREYAVVVNWMEEVKARASRSQNR